MEKNKVEDLYVTIRFLKEKSIISSGRRIKELKVEPIFRLIHNEILLMVLNVKIYKACFIIKN